MEQDSKPGVYMSSRHQNPIELAALQAPQKENFTVAAILGIVALIAGIAAVLLEYMEWQVISIG